MEQERHWLTPYSLSFPLHHFLHTFLPLNADNICHKLNKRVVSLCRKIAELLCNLHSGHLDCLMHVRWIGVYSQGNARYDAWHNVSFR